ncbi:MAG: hypothetical protein U1D55_05485 [Phycisphaerae bacterium]
MRTNREGIALLAIGLTAALAVAQAPLNTTFSYQGRLLDGGAPPPTSNHYDMQFQLHSDPVANAPVGPTLCVDDVPHDAGGLINVALNFGSVFGNTALYLQIGIRQDSIAGNCGSGGYTPLSGRQALTNAPFASYALNADTLDGLDSTTLQNAANLTGTLADARLSSNVALLNTAQTFTANKFFNGNVGIGTTTPAERLQVFGGNVMANEYRGGNGAARFISDLGDGSGGVRIDNIGSVDIVIDSDNNDANTRQFRVMSNGAARGSATNLLTMTEAGVATFTGLANLNGGAIVNGVTTTNGLLSVNAGASVLGDLTMAGDDSTIRFGDTVAPNSPMIEMFTSSTTNSDRTVIAHSAAFPNWGLSYRDSSDTFVFQSSATTPVLSADLVNLRVGVATLSPTHTLDIDGPARIRPQSNTNLLIQNPGGNNDDVALDFVKDSNTTVASRILFDGYTSQTQHQGSIGFWTRSGTDAAIVRRMLVAETGEVQLFNNAGANTITLDADLAGDGRVITQELQITGGSDLSEQFEVDGGATAVEPGMVVCIDPTRPGELAISRSAYDPTVAGIVSGAGGVKPGMLMGQHGTKADGKHAVALTGRVYCWVDASFGAIHPGDLLTTSDTPGHAMKAADRERSHGAILGKAMSSLESGRGLVLVLVNLQ